MILEIRDLPFYVHVGKRGVVVNERLDVFIQLRDTYGFCRHGDPSFMFSYVLFGKANLSKQRFRRRYRMKTQEKRTCRYLQVSIL